MIVTSSAPSPRYAKASSQATTPPPSTASRRGTTSLLVASRLVHGFASARPGTGGTAASLPTARTTACRAVNTWVEPSCAWTTTRFSPSSRPCPRTAWVPVPSTHRTWPSSSWRWPSKPVKESRRLSTAAGSSGPTSMPGSRVAASRTSIGRSIALLGMQAQ
jgi:hypothetical protein